MTIKWWVYAYSEEHGWQFTGIIRGSRESALMATDNSEYCGPFEAVAR
jgi:hypothetical protein